MHPDELLAGPRGRRLCAELVRAYGHSHVPDGRITTDDQVARCLDAVFSGPDPEAAIFGALRESVAVARYWQDPDEDDRRLADPEVVARLGPIAEAVADHPSTQWWTRGVEIASQVFATTDVSGRSLPSDMRAVHALRTLHDETVAENDRMKAHRRVGGEDRWAMTSAIWWSPPIGAVARSARTHPRFGPLGLHLEEDAFADDMRTWPIRPPDGVRVLEIDSMSAWADLVRSHPIDVTFARGANWLQATGRDAAWALPDWQAVAARYDAVHLSVAGYLAVSGRVIDLDASTASFVAAWNPDEAYWLTDVERLDDGVRRWHRADDGDWRAIG